MVKKNHCVPNKAWAWPCLPFPTLMVQRLPGPRTPQCSFVAEETSLGFQSRSAASSAIGTGCSCAPLEKKSLSSVNLLYTL